MSENKKQEENKINNIEECEETTKNGEFICSYFTWISLPEQKKKVEKLEKITKNNEKKK